MKSLMEYFLVVLVVFDFLCYDIYAQVPVIDLSQLGKDVKTSIEIDLALQEYGMFIGMNVLEESIADKFIKAANDLFGMECSEKERIQVKEGGFMRGYIPFGRESGLVDKYFEPKEGFSYGYTFQQNDLPYTNSLEGENIWPSEEHFTGQYALKLLFDISTRISINIIRSVSASYKHHTGENLGVITDGGERISIMRLFHYFAKSSEELKDYIDDGQRIMGSSPHTDWGLLTVITQQEHIHGLQTYYNGEWVDVSSDITGSVVVNGGDFLSLLSKGRYKSPIHRVLAPESQNRLSYVYFYYPNFNTPLDMAHSLKARSSVQIGVDEDSERFNTLVSEDAIKFVDKEGDSNVVFGDYIISKWKGVFKHDDS